MYVEEWIKWDPHNKDNMNMWKLWFIRTSVFLFSCLFCSIFSLFILLTGDMIWIVNLGRQMSSAFVQVHSRQEPRNVRTWESNFATVLVHHSVLRLHSYNNTRKAGEFTVCSFKRVQLYMRDFLMATRERWNHTQRTAALLHEASLQQQCDEKALSASAWQSPWPHKSFPSVCKCWACR